MTLSYDIISSVRGIEVVSVAGMPCYYFFLANKDKALPEKAL